MAVRYAVGTGLASAALGAALAFLANLSWQAMAFFGGLAGLTSYLAVSHWWREELIARGIPLPRPREEPLPRYYGVGILLVGVGAAAIVRLTSGSSDDALSAFVISVGGLPILVHAFRWIRRTFALRADSQGDAPRRD
jgi:hypothetical protein